MVRIVVVVLASVLVGCGLTEQAAFPDQAQLDELASAMTFYASFEDGMDAAQARDDRRIYSAPSYGELADRGPWYWGQNVSTAHDSGAAGHALSFNGDLTQALFYSAVGNVSWSEGGAISFWIQPGESAGTPVSIAPVGDGGAGLAVTLDASELSVAVGGQQVTAKGGELQGEQWINVVVSIANGGEATLYLNGAEQGSAQYLAEAGSEPATIRLAVDYAGLLDELAIFDRAVTAAEVRFLYSTPGLPASLMR